MRSTRAIELATIAPASTIVSQLQGCSCLGQGRRRSVASTAHLLINYRNLSYRLGYF